MRRILHCFALPWEGRGEKNLDSSRVLSNFAGANVINRRGARWDVVSWGAPQLEAMKIDKNEALNTGIQLMKYGVIGVMNTLITLVTFYLLNSRLGLSYGISNVTGYVLGVINSFLWNRNWVFKTRNNIKREALLFGCGFLLCLGLQLCVSWVLLEGLGWKDLPDDIIPFFPMRKAGQNIVMVIAMVAYTIANYAYNRFITFRQGTKE